jgi:hypothetical protein
MDIQIAARARECFEAYRSLEYGKFGSANDAQAREINKRLRQLGWIIEQVISLCQYSADQHRQLAQTLAVSPDKYLQQIEQMGRGQIALNDQIELHTETFYWIAHRAGAVIRSMPGLSSFNAIGVRNVRNWLLEHVEGPSGSVNVGIGWGSGGGFDGILAGGKGPTIATLIAGKDSGLYCNATEFFDEVERVTRRCIQRPELII